MLVLALGHDLVEYGLEIAPHGQIRDKVCIPCLWEARVPHGLDIAFGWTAQKGEYAGGGSDSLPMIGGLSAAKEIDAIGECAKGAFGVITSP